MILCIMYILMVAWLNRQKSGLRGIHILCPISVTRQNARMSKAFRVCVKYLLSGTVFNFFRNPLCSSKPRIRIRLVVLKFS